MASVRREEYQPIIHPQTTPRCRRAASERVWSYRLVERERLKPSLHMPIEYAILKGSDTNKPILLLNCGFSQALEEWSTELVHGLRKTYCVVAWNYPGVYRHFAVEWNTGQLWSRLGDTADPSPTKWHEYDQLLGYHALLREVLKEELGSKKPFYIGGWSMGGIFTYYLLSWYAACGQQPFEGAIIFSGRTYETNNTNPIQHAANQHFLQNNAEKVSLTALHRYDDWSTVGRVVLNPYGSPADVAVFNELHGLFPKPYLKYLGFDSCCNRPINCLAQYLLRKRLNAAHANPLPLPVLDAEGNAIKADSGTYDTASTILVNLNIAEREGFKSNTRVLVLHGLLDIIVPPGYYAAATGTPTPHKQSYDYGVPDPHKLGLKARIDIVFPQLTHHLFEGQSSQPSSDETVPGGHAFVLESAFGGRCCHLFGLVPAIVNRITNWHHGVADYVPKKATVNGPGKHHAAQYSCH
eukprot:TRINITY_DN14893_c0_g2_i1.p1 TRINITY_DN14893_c0_g2~~TRINITY_DN14893_c0_g2_i1.p1  ORF type:complete len:467 (+),score=48.41 TRINITY_DN14893_c0_g2_i1:68-1468(+)